MTDTETLDTEAPDRETQAEIDNGVVPDGYELVSWPESQEFMGEDSPIGEGEAILVNNGPLYNEHGDVCFLIPEEALYDTYVVSHDQVVSERITKQVQAKSKDEALQKVKEEGEGEIRSTKFIGWLHDLFEDMAIQKKG
jgi:hypothetical protein